MEPSYWLVSLNTGFTIRLGWDADQTKTNDTFVRDHVVKDQDLGSHHEYHFDWAEIGRYLVIEGDTQNIQLEEILLFFRDLPRKIFRKFES